MRLVDSAETRETFPWKFQLDYTVKFTNNTLTSEMRITNRDENTMRFNMALQGFYSVCGLSKSPVKNLGGDYKDLVTDETRKCECSGALFLKGTDEVSRVYKAPKDGVCIDKAGPQGLYVVNVKSDLPDATVWNCGKSRFAAHGFGAEDWNSFISVGTGHEKMIDLEAGKTWSTTQVATATRRIEDVDEFFTH
eukprot:GHVO01029546.1.p1 GENE.GHVO01029546.1~~GHVO01029546.1.p1  ORF type:complete len:193 (-),score=19.31 GHVO01029546.1:127-705(-)